MLRKLGKEEMVKSQVSGKERKFVGRIYTPGAQSGK